MVSMCGSRGGGRGSRPPLENHKNIGFLSNTGPDHLKITKLPSQHSMLRMQCSALNADLYRKNIVESPSCQHCGGFESAYHIFFTCPLYAATRRYLRANLHEYSLKDLLYGTEHGTSHENEILFLKVQDF